MTGRHYHSGSTVGYVVESMLTFDRRDGKRVTSRTFWYGPDHAWGTTSGPLDYSAIVWPTRAAAMRALDTVYGSADVWSRRGYHVRRLATVIKERDGE